MLLVLLPGAMTSSPWSTTSLSSNRDYLTAAGVGTKIMFAGGQTDGSVCLLRPEHSLISSLMQPSRCHHRGYLRYQHPRVEHSESYRCSIFSCCGVSRHQDPLWWRVCAAPALIGACFFFSHRSCRNAVGRFSTAVDIYEDSTGAWTVGSLSEGRYGLAAASSGNIIVFAGGECVLCHRWAAREILTRSSGSIAGYSTTVDIYDVSTGLWNSTSKGAGKLSVPRTSLSGAGIGGTIIFAGGGCAPDRLCLLLLTARFVIIIKRQRH
jgi:hypothetical protein